MNKLAIVAFVAVAFLTGAIFANSATSQNAHAQSAKPVDPCKIYNGTTYKVINTGIKRDANNKDHNCYDEINKLVVRGWHIREATVEQDYGWVIHMTKY